MAGFGYGVFYNGEGTSQQSSKVPVRKEGTSLHRSGNEGISLHRVQLSAFKSAP